MQSAELIDHRAELLDHEARLQVLEAPPEIAWRDIAIDTTIPYTPPVWPRPVISLKADTMTRCHVCRHPVGHEGGATLVLEHRPGTRIFEEVKRYPGVKKIEARDKRKFFSVCKECASTLAGTIYIITMGDKANDGA
jgi:hypothetical protein